MSIGSHQACIGKSQTHLTPRWILDSLGPFDCDPCAAESMPWETASRMIALPENGLSADWHGRVWMNPPFDRRVVGEWVRKFFDHGNGICLLHARTETDWFQPVWERADGILFLRKRVKFCDETGREAEANSGAPVVLAAVGEITPEMTNYGALVRSGLDGWMVYGKQKTTA